jgi:LPS export ABC transporter protein LptC
MRRPRLRLLLIAVTTLAVAVVLIRLVSRIRVDDLVRVETLADEALPELLQRIRDFHRVVTRNGQKVLEISAQEASYFRDTSAVEIVQPSVLFFDRGEKVGEISGGRGTLVLDEGEVSSVEVTEGVHLSFVNFQIEADSAFYDRVAKIVVTHGRAVLRSDQFEVSGTGMTVDLGAETLRIVDGVDMRVFRSARAPVVENAPGEVSS